MVNNLINPTDYSKIIQRLRSFFLYKGYVEVPVQHRLSILAACEDPTTMATFNYAGNVWPLPQTGQMWLEYELLKNPDYPGVFCISTSYRQEPHPKEGRHDLIFPMFEFESKGNINDLKILERELCTILGYASDKSSYNNMTDSYINIYPSCNYEQLTTETGNLILTADDEEYLHNKYGNVVFIERFPERTSPFWNMKRNVFDGQILNQNKTNVYANKIDVILHGIETIGSAERETDTKIMEERFYSISNGQYADTLFAHFGEDRVRKELDDFLSLNFFSRFGGGIGITRLIRSQKMLNKQ